MQGNYDLNEASVSDKFQSTYAEMMARAQRLTEFLKTKEEILKASFLTVGPLGEAVVNHAELEKRLEELYDAAHWVYDNGDYDYDQVIEVDGVRKTLREHMFSKKTIESINVIREHYKEKANSIFLSKEERAIYAQYAKEIDNKPSRAVFASLLMDMIDQRTRLNSHYPRIGVNQVDAIRWMMIHYLRMADKDTNPTIDRVRKMPPSVDKPLFGKLFQVYGRPIEELSFWEFLYTFFAMFISLPRNSLKHS
jgi:hypothetical protein